MIDQIVLLFQKSLALIVLLGTTLIPGAFSQDIETFLRPYAEEIVGSSSHEFVNGHNGRKYSSMEGLPPMENLKVEPLYYRWHYTSALVHDGLLSLGTELGEEDYSNFGREYFRFVFDNQVYLSRLRDEGYTVEGLERFGRFRGLWDNGAQAAALIRVYEGDPRPDYLAYLEQMASISAYQTKTGLWKHLVDHPDSYEETSGSVYVVYAIARGKRKYLSCLFPEFSNISKRGSSFRPLIPCRCGNDQIVENILRACSTKLGSHSEVKYPES